jgi:hypothetical protein
MTSHTQNSSLSKPIHQWIVSLSVMFFSIFGVLIALLYLFAFSDVRPLDGGFYYVGSSVIMTTFLVFQLRKAGTKNIAISTNLSDKIIKWLVALFSLFYIFCGLALSLLCLFNETGVIYFKSGAVYFISSAFVLAAFVFAVWKK